MRASTAHTVHLWPGTSNMSFNPRTIEAAGCCCFVGFVDRADDADPTLEAALPGALPAPCFNSFKRAPLEFNDMIDTGYRGREVRPYFLEKKNGLWASAF